MSDEVDLFRGDLPAILHRHRDATVAALREQKMPPRRAQLAVRARLLLRATAMLEGWGVSLARWMLEAASTGGAQHGAADRLLETCQSALDPSLPALLARTRATGLALRSDAALALGQCAASHGLWAALAAEGGASATGEFNRFFWRPLHFASAAGAGDVVQELLRLGADPSRPNGAGLTPLHVAVAHHSLPAVRVLARVPLPDGEEVESALDFALRSGLSEDRCVALLDAMGHPKRSRRKACAAAARERAAVLAAQADEPRAPRPRACDDGGGWAVASGGGGGGGGSSRGGGRGGGGGGRGRAELEGSCSVSGEEGDGVGGGEGGDGAAAAAALARGGGGRGKVARALLPAQIEVSIALPGGGGGGGGGGGSSSGRSSRHATTASRSSRATAVASATATATSYAERAKMRRCDIDVVRTIEAGPLLGEYLSASRPVLVTDAMVVSDDEDEKEGEEIDGEEGEYHEEGDEEYEPGEVDEEDEEPFEGRGKGKGRGSKGGGIYAAWRRAAFVARHGRVVVSPEPYPYAHAAAHLYGLPPDNSSSVAKWLDSGGRFDRPGGGGGGSRGGGVPVGGGRRGGRCGTGAGARAGAGEAAVVTTMAAEAKDAEEAEEEEEAEVEEEPAGVFNAIPARLGWARLPSGGGARGRRTRHGMVKAGSWPYPGHHGLIGLHLKARGRS